MLPISFVARLKRIFKTIGYKLTDCLNKRTAQLFAIG